MLEIKVVKLVYRPTYRLDAYDVLQIQVTGTLRDQPIDGYHLVEAEGTVNLGPAYGTVRVAGMTVEEANRAVTNQLLHTLREPQVSVQLARTSGAQQIGGIYLVGRDGTVNLRQYGAVAVSGRTLSEARLAIQENQLQFFDSPEISVGIPGSDSDAYYVITEGAGLDDYVVCMSVTGNKTLWDVVGQCYGLSELSTKQILIARPSPGNAARAQILPVNWGATSRDGVTARDFKLLPGDRVFVTDRPAAADKTAEKVYRAAEPRRRLLLRRRQ